VYEGDVREDWKRYGDKKFGRLNFQIDLAMEMMKEGIKIDWPAPYTEASKPAWIRKSPRPCACGVCFFCETGKTIGISHNSRKKPPLSQPSMEPPKQCSAERTNFSGSRSGTICRACYRKHREERGKELTRTEIVKLCNKTTNGCAGCQTIICNDCWPEYKHDITGNVVNVTVTP